MSTPGLPTLLQGQREECLMVLGVEKDTLLPFLCRFVSILFRFRETFLIRGKMIEALHYSQRARCPILRP